MSLVVTTSTEWVQTTPLGDRTWEQCAYES